MRVGIATDHGGFGLKEDLVAQLRAAGHDVVDFGAELRQRCGRLDLRQQASGCPCRADP